MLLRATILLIWMLASSPLWAQWVQTSLGDAQYGYNAFSDSTGIWAATLNGVYRTTDTGDPWYSLGLTGRLVFDVITSGPYLLAATEGSGPGVYRTSDNGASWLSSTGIADQSVRAFAKNGSFVFACTWGGGVFRSSNDGATWEPRGLTNHGFRSIFAAGDRILVGGDSIFVSTDSGTSWIGRRLPYPAGDTWCFAQHNGKLYAGDMGLYVSEDLGMTWDLLYGVAFDSTGTPSDVKIFYDLASYDQTMVGAIGAGGIGISRDNGASWTDWNDGLITDWTFAALAIRPPYIWALRGAFGNAYRRPLSEIATSVDDAGDLLPGGSRLAQNYPNPFNPTTSIGYSVGVVSRESLAAARVTLAVYDVLGREVAVLVDEQKQPGEYTTTWDASGRASGMYIYRLTAGERMDVKRMVLVK